MEELITLPLNKFAQGIIDYDRLFKIYQELDGVRRDSFKKTLLELISQSRCKDIDVDLAIKNSRLKPTKNCCVIAKKGIYYHNLRRVYLSDNDEVSICLLVNIFKIGYLRRRSEDDNPAKWWNLDLSK